MTDQRDLSVLTPEFTDDLAERFVRQCAATWEKLGMPPAALIDATTVWGLRSAVAGQGPEAVAAGLERIAESIRELGAVPDDVVLH